MRSQLTVAVLILAPALALAQTADQAADQTADQAADQTTAETPAETPAKSRAAHSSVPTSGEMGAPAVEFITFEPTPFESRMFLDPDRITQTTGEDIYGAVCEGCHMPDAKGAVGAAQYPALAGNDNLVVGDYPVLVIVNGLHAMPPFRQVLDDEQIVAVVEYLQGTLEDTDVYPPTLETVRQARAAADPLPE